MTLVVAHRGASRVEPENTLAAFAAAVRLGADMVELDVRLTADGALAVVHDPVLADGRPVHVLAQADLPVGVPLLDDALDTCRPLSVNIELKNSPKERGFDPHNRVADAVAEVVVARGDEGRVLVSSFHLLAIDRMKVVAPVVETARLVSVVRGQARLVAETAAGGHQGIHPWHALVTRRLVARVHEAGLALRPWTVDDPERIRTLAAMGVDAIVTNVPDLARSALARPPGGPDGP